MEPRRSLRGTLFSTYAMWEEVSALNLMHAAPVLAMPVFFFIGRHDHVIAYLNGHNHDGNYGLTDGTHFLNFKGMVDTRDTSAFAIVAVYPDRLEVTGYGREESRVLPLPARFSGA